MLLINDVKIQITYQGFHVRQLAYDAEFTKTVLMFEGTEKKVN